MAAAQPTIDEIVAIVRRSSLSTILVEGTSDAKYYRWVERASRSRQSNRLPTADVVPCGGRSNLLQIFHRRDELGPKPVAFVADSDVWAITAAPQEYAEVIFTEGYSIENDVLAGRHIEKMFFSESDQNLFDKLLAVLADWFAFEIDCLLKDERSCLSYRVDEIIDLSTRDFRSNFVMERGYRSIQSSIADRIRSAPRRLIRGKTVLQALRLTINQRAGAPPRYDEDALIEICLCTDTEHPQRDLLISRIMAKLESVMNSGWREHNLSHGSDLNP